MKIEYQGLISRQVTKIELLSCLVLVTGTVLDHVSTRVVLSLPGTYEGNNFIAFLMSMNLGFLFDLLFIPTLIMASYLLYDRVGRLAIAIPVFNIVFGARRFHAFFHNLLVFSQALNSLKAF